MTQEQTWTFVDRSRWPRLSGEWENEPDKIQWIDEDTGLDCLIHRGPHGALCGYVGLPPGHRFHGADYDSELLQRTDEDGDTRYLDVHGGLTFADRCGPHNAETGQGICHVPAPGRPDDVWWLGFDCAHSGDHCPGYQQFSGWASYKRVAYVKHQCKLLAAQLA